VAKTWLRAHVVFGLPGDDKEALAFALMGHAILLDRPADLPATAGRGARWCGEGRACKRAEAN
jgi:1,6-anhydro-N-acetylmuramate kinase